MNLFHILYFSLPIIGLSLLNFFLKNLRKIFSSVEIIVLIHMIYHIFILPSFIITYFRDKKKVTSFINKIIKLDIKTLISCFMFFFLGISSQFGLNSLLKYYDVTYIIPIIRGVGSIILVIIGYFIFKEKITLKKLIGILSVVFGIYLITSQ